VTEVSGSIAEWLGRNSEALSEKLFDTIYWIAFDLGPAVAKGLYDGTIKELPNAANGFNTGLIRSGSRLFNKTLAFLTGDESLKQLDFMTYAQEGDNEKGYEVLRKAWYKDGTINKALASMINNAGGNINPITKGWTELWASASVDEADEAQKFLSNIEEQLTDALTNEQVAQEVKLAIQGRWEELGQIVSLYGGAIIPVVDGLVKNAGDTAVADFKKGLDDAQTVVESTHGPALVEKFKNVMEDIKTLNWMSVGANAVAGISSGIENNKGSIASKLISAVAGGISSLSNYLVINSPSKLMADEIGQYIPAGIAVGIDSNADVIATSMESLGELTKNTASTMVDNTNNGSEGIMSGIIADSMRDALMETIMTADAGSGDGAQEIVLSVDGEDLARATVRGLRRIDKRTSAMVSFA
jgi:CHASE3 domain sensor protein